MRTGELYRSAGFWRRTLLLSGQGLIADSGRHQGSAAGRGVSSFLELALQERSPLINRPWVEVAYCCFLDDVQK